jgi:chromosome segregation ATPase
MDKGTGDKSGPWQVRLESKVEGLEEGQNHLKNDVRELKGDVQELKSDVRGLKDGQKRLEVGQQKLESYFKFIRESLDRYQTENKRHFEVLIEHHKSERSILGEGVKGNRERLDDHEMRIQALEAS